MLTDEPSGRSRRGYGVVLPLAGVPLAAHRDILRELVDLGYDHVWAGEATALDGITPIAAAAAWAPELGIGTAVIPVFTRGPALLASTAAALAELAPGRVSLGLGASSPLVVDGWNAGHFDQPYQRVADTIAFLRRALAGERVEGTYPTFAMSSFRLARPPAEPPALLVGALRPRMLTLAATEADGAVTTAAGASDIERISAGLHQAGGRRLVAWISVCPSADAETVRQRVRAGLTSYLCVPAYAAFHRWLGRGELLAPMWAAWAAGDRRAAAAALPDAVIDELVVHGPPEACREHLARFRAAGVTDLALSLDPLLGDPLQALRALAPAAAR